MKNIKVGFITPNMRADEPRWLDLPAVPCKGDEITLDAGSHYEVSRVHWSFTSQGFGCIEVDLKPLAQG